jgi:predicted AlkP superfamily pyrophosphatase or phosphodiesterase
MAQPSIKSGEPMKNHVTVWMAVAIGLAVLAAGCSTDTGGGRQHPNPVKIRSAQGEKSKPVILILIDSLMDKQLQEAIRQKRAPAMAFLTKRGDYHPHVVSSFPTMSVTIDSTLLTGTYADLHHVPGLVWYSSDRQRMIYYGNGFKEAMKIDQMQVFMDAVYELNQAHLNKDTKTIHEVLAGRGRESASINGIVYRGTTEHALKLPQFLQLSKLVPKHMTVMGPRWFSYASLAQIDPENDRNARPWRRFGMNNDYTAQEVAYMIKHRIIPGVTVAYLPENDSAVHRRGPDELDGIEKADQALQVAMNAYGSWEEAVKQAVWIVMGDSAQSKVFDDRQKAVVDLLPLLSRYRVARLSQPVTSEDQIVIAPNERMAYIYAIDDHVQMSEVVKLLRQEDKLDIIAASNGREIEMTSGHSDGKLSYRIGGGYKDEYGQTWTLSGDPAIADITISGSRIEYGRYPDILARLYGAMHSHEGRYAVITTQPGYELVGESSPTHIGGGSHGSLHEKDSLVPMIIAGTNTRPRTMRIVDVKDWIIRLSSRE